MKKKQYTTAFAIPLVFGLVSCLDTEVDNTYSKNRSVIQIKASSDVVVLDESRPNDVSLTLEWNEATDYGVGYTPNYEFMSEVSGSKQLPCTEAMDSKTLKRSYTNAELQQLLVDHFGCLTSSNYNMIFTMTATFDGPRVVIPDQSSVTVKVKTFGEKQFAGDKILLSGSAVGGDDIVVREKNGGSGIYVYKGPLKAGSLYFAVFYEDEENAICPQTAETNISDDEMPCIVVDRTKAHTWKIPESSNYRVTLDMNKHVASIIRADNLVEVDRMFLDGTATNGKQIEVEQTIEDENIYAWRGHLNMGRLYLPLLFDGMQQMSIVPAAGSHDINDGETREFSQVITATETSANYWDIPTEGTYRIVVDIDERKITIYSPVTDLKNQRVTYNNTALGKNPYTQEITQLWMWGGYNSLNADGGMKPGFQSQYVLKQSLADPCVFVYKGEELPRDFGQTETYGQEYPSVKFMVSNDENNVWCYGSTANAVRNSFAGYEETVLGKTYNCVSGQSHNRYSYFVIPEGCNFVKVTIREASNPATNPSAASTSAIGDKWKMSTVVFDRR